MAAGVVEGRLTEEQLVEKVWEWKQVRLDEAVLGNDLQFLRRIPGIPRDEDKVTQAYDRLRDLGRQADVLYRGFYPSVRTRPGVYPVDDLRYKRTYFKHWDGTYQNFSPFADFYCLYSVPIAGEAFSVQNWSHTLHITRGETDTPSVEITEGREPLIHLPDKYPVPVDVAFSNWNFCNGRWYVDVPEQPTHVTLSPKLATERDWEIFQATEEHDF